jgi:hypothetical protein
MGGGLAVQLTATFVTAAAATVPEPPVTAQVCPDGCVLTVTLYVAALANAVLNVNDPFALTASVSPPLFWSASPLPVSPETDPPMV